MFRRRIPFNEIAVATLVGVVGGIYVYKPMFEPLKQHKSAEPQEDIKQEQDAISPPVDKSK